MGSHVALAGSGALVNRVSVKRGEMKPLDVGRRAPSRNAHRIEVDETNCCHLTFFATHPRVKCRNGNLIADKNRICIRRQMRWRNSP